MNHYNYHPGWEVVTSTAPPQCRREQADNSRVHFFSASQEPFCLTASNDHLKTSRDNTPTHTPLPVYLKYQHRWKATDVKPTLQGLACNTQQWALFSKLGKSRMADRAQCLQTCDRNPRISWQWGDYLKNVSLTSEGEGLLTVDYGPLTLATLRVTEELVNW